MPSYLCASDKRKLRFEREARAISLLQHPNICTLYDIGSQDGIDFLVMEYLEGQTLADRLAKGALPIEQALRVGTEIAEALEIAHRHGIVHRDLKPGNIMLTKSGAKLMDFGLAKPAAIGAAAGAESAPLLSAVKTMTSPALSTPRSLLRECWPEQCSTRHRSSYRAGSRTHVRTSSPLEP